MHITAGRRCLDSVIGYANCALIQTGGSVCLEKFLSDMLGLAEGALPEVVIRAQKASDDQKAASSP